MHWTGSNSTFSNVRIYENGSGGAAGELNDFARSYLHSNCAGCHRPSGPTPANMDLRYQSAFDATNTCNAIPVSGDLGVPGARVIVPEDANASLLVNRASRRDIHGMPPLGSNIADIVGVGLLTNQINVLRGCP